MGIEFPLPQWMEWVVAAGTAILGAGALYVIDWIEKKRQK